MPKVLKMTATLLLFALLLVQPAYTASFLVQIATYVAGTAGLAGSVAQLSSAVRDGHKAWIEVGNIEKCRSHKSSLRELTIKLRDIQETKIRFRDNLDGLARGRISPSSAWRG